MSHAQVLDQENLIEISYMDFSTLVESFFSKKNDLLPQYKNFSDNFIGLKAHYRKIGEKILSVTHFAPKNYEELKIVYKVDKDLWSHLQTIKRFQ